MKIGDSIGKDPSVVGGVGQKDVKIDGSTVKENNSPAPDLEKIAGHREKTLSGRVAKLSGADRIKSAPFDPVGKKMIFLSADAVQGNREARAELGEMLDQAAGAAGPDRPGSQFQRLMSWINVAVALMGGIICEDNGGPSTTSACSHPDSSKLDVSHPGISLRAS